MAARESLPLTSFKLGYDDRVSPFKIAVLVFIREYCTARLAQLGMSPHSYYNSIPPFSSQQCKDFCLLSLELIQCYDVTWEDFEIILEPGHYNLSTKIISEFTRSLHQIVKDGASGLLDLGESLEKLLMEPAKGKPMIRKDSVLGIFIRKMVLQMDRMTFEATVELSNNLATYLDKSNKSEDPLELVQVSRKQAELLVSQQLTMLQRNESLAHSPVNLQKIIDRILHENKDFAEANFLAHLNEMRCQDFGQAEKRLHQSYDQGTISIEGLIHSKLEDNLMNNKTFRHASLNMAFLHASFGHHELAVTALCETVALSGEAADHTCLQESLAWFCHLEENPEMRLKMMERLVTKSSESNLHYLASLGLAMWTQDCTLAGVEPKRIFEYLHTNDVANCQHSLTDMTLTCLALRAAIWNFYGYPRNALQVSQLLLTLHTGDPTKGNIYYNNEHMHMAVCNIALHLSRQGRYADAESITKFAAGQYANCQQHSQVWKMTDLHVTFYRTLWLGQWDKAELIISQLAVFNRSESLAKMAHLMLCKGDTCQGKLVLNSLEERLSNAKEPNNHRMPNPGWRMGQKLRLQVQSMMLRSVLLSARQNFVEALLQISQALDICKKHHMNLQLALVGMQSAEIQLMMNYTANALDLVRKHINIIYTHGSLFEQGMSIFLLARCLLAETGTKLCDSMEFKSKKTEIFPLLTRAKKIFNQIEAFHHAKDVVFLEALLYHHLGYEKERNTRAMLFKQLDELYPLKTSNNIHIFIGL
ncbi:anaphase-promoting complex subunit 5-like [Daphnia carinata]|uniref:anaphase-promoting complex subunit 5-like n=1 Tax=Daphnia carinata TaxID=120202 RepID=UPI0025807C6D|nr:anaphase-promoting complex subunit 5-like [Daphnia carinata]